MEDPECTSSRFWKTIFLRAPVLLLTTALRGSRFPEAQEALQDLPAPSLPSPPPAPRHRLPLPHTLL